MVGLAFMVKGQKSRQAVETEVKIACRENPLTSHPGIEVTLVEPRHFEDNWLFDYDDHRLAATHCALRLRIVAQRGWLTFKSSLREHPWLKIREEMQVGVEEPEVMLAILEAIGLQRVFRYQKFRTHFKVTLPSGKSLDALFDETPMGNFLELEGEEAVIAELVKQLGVSTKDLIQTSYPTLWAARQKARGQPMPDMVFSETQWREG